MARSVGLEGEVEVMNRRRLAALVAAAFMMTANAFEASAQESQSDDWLNFDQSGDSRDQTARGQALAPEVEVQPEQGFPTLAKENVTAAKNASSSMQRSWRAEGGRNFRQLSCGPA